MRIREQEQSLACWDALTSTSRFGSDPSAWRTGQKDEAAYLAALKKTASRIYVAGLGPAIAFLRSRNKEINGKLADDLGRLVLTAMGRNAGNDASGQLIGVLRQASDVATVAWATEEALAACTWLMRYLEGEGVSPSEDED